MLSKCLENAYYGYLFSASTQVQYCAGIMPQHSPVDRRHISHNGSSLVSLFRCPWTDWYFQSTIHMILETLNMYSTLLNKKHELAGLLNNKQELDGSLLHIHSTTLKFMYILISDFTLLPCVNFRTDIEIFILASASPTYCSHLKKLLGQSCQLHDTC